jgi:hypothetical protein
LARTERPAQSCPLQRWGSAGSSAEKQQSREPHQNNQPDEDDVADGPCSSMMKEAHLVAPEAEDVSKPKHQDNGLNEAVRRQPCPNGGIGSDDGKREKEPKSVAGIEVRNEDHQKDDED